MVLSRNTSLSHAPLLITVPPASMMWACTFGRTATTSRIRGNGIRLNAVESASASVAVGTITLTMLHSDGLRPVAGSTSCVNRPLGGRPVPVQCDPVLVHEQAKVPPLLSASASFSGDGPPGSALSDEKCSA